MQGSVVLPSILRNSICFKDVAWLQKHSLDASTALDYFSTSPFYEKSCNNEVLKMQQRPVTESTLSTLLGTEYILAESSEMSTPLYLIYQRFRKGTNAVSITGAYYILEGVIYPCPTLGDLITSKVRALLNSVSKAVDSASQSITFTLLSGHSWNVPGIANTNVNQLGSTSMIQLVNSIISRLESHDKIGE